MHLKIQSFPKITLKSNDDLIFNHSSNLCKQLLDWLLNETDEISLEEQ